MALPAFAADAPSLVHDALISRENGKVHIRVHYPVTGNARVDADVAAWARQVVDTFQSTYGEEPDLGVPYELETTYSTTRPSPSVLSIVWKTASYTGGAHGNLEISTTTYDMQSGTLIDLYDVFADLDAALSDMSAFCTRKLSRTLGDMYNKDMLEGGTAPEADNFSSFALTPAGIRIFFQPIRSRRGRPGRRPWTSPSTPSRTPGPAFPFGEKPLGQNKPLQIARLVGLATGTKPAILPGTGLRSMRVRPCPLPIPPRCPV